MPYSIINYDIRSVVKCENSHLIFIRSNTETIFGLSFLLTPRQDVLILIKLNIGTLDLFVNLLHSCWQKSYSCRLRV